MKCIKIFFKIICTKSTVASIENTLLFLTSWSLLYLTIRFNFINLQFLIYVWITGRLAFHMLCQQKKNHSTSRFTLMHNRIAKTTWNDFCRDGQANSFFFCDKKQTFIKRLYTTQKILTLLSTQVDFVQSSEIRLSSDLHTPTSYPYTLLNT